jgi:hypothetical protein
VFADRGTDIAALSEASVLPAQPPPVALLELMPVRMRANVPNDSVAVHEVLPAEVTVPVMAPAHLRSTSIPFLARVPTVAARPTADAEGIDWAAWGRPPAVAGVAVARASTATGWAASKAGTSVSRFFKNGGLAIARSF